MITIILGGVEIHRFKETRKKSYYKLLSKICNHERESCKLVKNFWKKIDQSLFHDKMEIISEDKIIEIGEENEIEELLQKQKEFV